MLNNEKGNNQAKPLIYDVRPESTKQVFSNQENRLQEQEQREESEQEQTLNKEEKIEKIKREFGVYEAMAEIEREIRTASQWVEPYREPKQPEPQVIQEEQPVVEEVVSKKKKRRPKPKPKQKQESVAETITRLAHSREEPRPTCVAHLFGEEREFEVLGIRGEMVKIRIGHRVRIIRLSDLKSVKVIKR
ncbi:hypothetical protein D1953_15935 [Peribacillus asahii]|uniref:Uncharacterized protein n=1 Tax=Peribacillus asahii TaxID=228899 RepID=A0A398B162_9BACI|nr:hypothetical protein [Peribacillus asahii]RID83555.1 hypothetical protein D1953_15935 [Peribacillus asahii]USK60835.1 hypothetical protein LIT37_05780 [Peribacillus asahii]